MMKEIKDYTIASATTAEQLISIVKDAMRQGWQPQGGVEAEAFGFFQALVKYA